MVYDIISEKVTCELLNGLWNYCESSASAVQILSPRQQNGWISNLVTKFWRQK